MMEYTVTTKANGIDFGASGLGEIQQNIRTILTTMSGTVPLDRRFGIDIVPLDAPNEMAKARMTSLIIEAVRTYEPRVDVLAITYEEQPDGVLVPGVKFRLAEGVVV